jgi:histidinol dehydrogenase
MAPSLDSILITAMDRRFASQIERLKTSMIEAARFSFAHHPRESQAVLDILRDVSENGTAAVRRYTTKFDGVTLTEKQMRITAAELRAAHRSIDRALLRSIRKAIDNVRRYQSEIFVGNCPSLRRHRGLKITPIRRVGICVPGASAPLPSTVIMTAVPAQVAGVEEVVVVSPPRYQPARGLKTIHPVILAVCQELKIGEVYRIGGAQAVAAMASTIGPIPKVDKIVGPGNRWVQTAKKLVLGYTGIDSIAGPSEVLILANGQANPAWVAADMLSQAEHAPGSAIVATDSQTLAENILAALKDQVRQLGRSRDTMECLTKYSKIVVFKSFEKAVEFANDFASEHLEIQCGGQSRKVLENIRNAGAIFVGPYTPVAVGDYIAGPSHTLPTGTSAKFFSALSANDFVKFSSVMEYSRKDLLADAEDILRLAGTEGLDAHARSVSIRVK